MTPMAKMLTKLYAIGVGLIVLGICATSPVAGLIVSGVGIIMYTLIVAVWEAIND